jgi:DNA-binding transcriptional LysR family regulator
MQTPFVTVLPEVDAFMRRRHDPLRNVNLNLLPILRSLLKTKSVSRAAAALHLSQPTVSDALSRLRLLFSDELLVRIGSGMKLTPRAMELLEPLESACGQLELLLRPGDFDPAKETREFVIASSDICTFLLGRQILELIRMEAPGISLHLTDIDLHLRDKMAAREIDFALLPEFAIHDLAPAPLRFAPLMQIDHVVVMSASHPLAAKDNMSEEDVVAYPVIDFYPDAVIPDPKRATVPWWRLDTKVEARVAQMLTIPHLLIGSNSIAFLTRQLGEEMAGTHPLVTRAMPVIDSVVTLGLVWSPVYDGDAAHRWFRESMVAHVPKKT